MKESDLSPPASAWLPTRAAVPMLVYAEVAWHGSCIDLVGLAGPDLFAVELKKALSKAVIAQAWRAMSFAREAWCIVGAVPRTDGLAFCSQRGIGVAAVGHDPQPDVPRHRRRDGRAVGTPMPPP